MPKFAAKTLPSLTRSDGYSGRTGIAVGPLYRSDRVACRWAAVMLGVALIWCTGGATTPDSTYFANTAFSIPSRILEAPNDREMRPEEVLSPDFDRTSDPVRYGISLTLGKTYWMRLDLRDLDLSKSNLWVVYLGYLDHIELYTQKGDSLVSTQGGLMGNAGGRRNSAIGPLGPGEFLVDTTDFIQGRYLIARLAPKIWYFATYVPEIYHPTLAMIANAYFSRSQLKRTIPHLVFLGSVFMMALFSLAVYIMTRERKVRFYLFYLVSLLLYLGVRAEPWVSWFHEQAFFAFYIYNELIQVVVNICYLLFVMAFLQTREAYPLLHKIIRGTVAILLLVMVLQIILLSGWETVRYERFVINFERYLMIAFTLGTYLYLWKKGKGTAVNIIVIGSLFFLTGAVIAMIFKDIQYLVLGAFLEIIVFSAGMGLDIRDTNRMKEKLRSEIDRVRLSALQAQMNPHFISNSLNSVRAYIIRNEQGKASEYLNNFAHLVRLILHYSSLNLITVNEELHAINLYVKLEALRHRMDFGYSTEVAQDVDPATVCIPPLIVQPFVENAILHGLAPSVRDKQLELRVSRDQGNVLVVTISDNGVGRKPITAQPATPEKRKSVAISLTRRRIQLMGQDSEKDFGVVISDRMQSDTPTGTEVTIRLPLLTIRDTNISIPI